MYVIRPVTIKAKSNYTIWIQYSDGVQGEVDLKYLRDKGIFAAWDDYTVFESVHLGEHGEILWDDDIDLCPDAIYLKITGQEPTDIFPSLKEAVNA